MEGFRLPLYLIFLGVLEVWCAVVPHRLLPLTPKGSLLQKGSRRGLSIYGGNQTYIEDHPYLVSVTFEGVLFCSGTIISKNWVLLSADCLNGYSTSEMEVVAGSRDGMSGTQTFGVAQGVSHPDYNYAMHTYDYGLIQIEGNFTWGSKVKKAKLPSHHAKPGTWLTMTGYGESEANGVIRAGKTQVLSKKECYKIYEGYTLNLTDTVGCVYNQGKTTICKHDSADPVTRAGVIYHIATAISDTGYCSSDAMPVITADICGAVSWIKEITGVD